MTSVSFNAQFAVPAAQINNITLFADEMCRRKNFYLERVGAEPISEEDRGNHLNTNYVLPTDSISVALKPLENSNENAVRIFFNAKFLSIIFSGICI